MLVTISGAENINALVEDQSIAFSPALTITFWSERFWQIWLRAAVRKRLFYSWRQRRSSESSSSRLRVEAAEGNADCALRRRRKNDRIQLGVSVRELAAFYVFDSTCVSAHLTQANILSFAPAGLSVLQELVEQTDGSAE